MRYVFIMALAVSIWGADATIEVIKETQKLPGIAVEDASEAFKGRQSKRFFRILQGDLNVLSLFNVDRHYAETEFEAQSVVNREMDYTLRYRLRTDDNDAFLADVRLLRGSDTVMQKQYRTGKVKMSPFIAHAIASDVNDHFGKPPVGWMKREVIFSRLIAPKTSEIVIADYTLSYQHAMIKGGLNVFPRWADARHKAFYYTELTGRMPTLIKVDRDSGARERVLESDGMLVCSDVSSDGRQILATMAPEGQPDVYLYDTTSGKKTRVTEYDGIDVNGQFLKDGRIVFVSNRLGHPNIFAKEIGAKAVEQLVYYGKENSACSAHDNYIVYKSRESSHAFAPNTFNLHLISLNTDFVRRLTATGMNEFPRFSEDGDAVIYIKNYKQQSALGVVRLAQNKNFLFPLPGGKIQALDW